MCRGLAASSAAHINDNRKEALAADDLHAQTQLAVPKGIFAELLKSSSIQVNMLHPRAVNQLKEKGVFSEDSLDDFPDSESPVRGQKAPTKSWDDPEALEVS